MFARIAPVALLQGPIRPVRNWQGDNYLGRYPASNKAKHRPVDLAAHAALLAKLDGLPAEQR